MLLEAFSSLVKSRQVLPDFFFFLRGLFSQITCLLWRRIWKVASSWTLGFQSEASMLQISGCFHTYSSCIIYSILNQRSLVSWHREKKQANQNMSLQTTWEGFLARYRKRRNRLLCSRLVENLKLHLYLSGKIFYMCVLCRIPRIQKACLATGRLLAHTWSIHLRSCSRAAFYWTTK